MLDVKFSPTEEVVLNLIYTDMKFIYNLIQDIEKQESANFAISLLPYLALVYKEAYKWCYKNKKLRKCLPKTPKKVESYYEYYREYNKLLKNDIVTINNNYEYQFNKTKNYFEKDRSNFSWNNINETSKDLYRLTKNIGEFFGHFINPYKDRITNNIKSIKIVDYDFGPRTSPFKNEYSDKFLIFDLLCKCNFVLYGLNNFTSTLLTSKLRFSYNLYFYICESIDKINNYYNTNFTINSKYKDDELRSAFMHYGIWKIVKDKVNPFDSFGGMTNIRLGINWNSLLIFTLSEIKSFSLQLDNYLSKNNLSHNYNIFNKA